MGGDALTHVMLTEDQITEADAFAHRRQAHARKSKARGSNGASDQPSKALSMHIHGTRCEYAAMLAFAPVQWNAFTEDVNDELPDLEDFIDVKGVNDDSRRIIIQAHKGHPDWAYVLVSSEDHPDYRIMGWCWGRDAMQDAYWEEHTGRPAYFYPNDLLLQPEALAHEIHRRQICPVAVPPRPPRRGRVF